MWRAWLYQQLLPLSQRHLRLTVEEHKSQRKVRRNL